MDKIKIILMLLFLLSACDSNVDLQTENNSSTPIEDNILLNYSDPADFKIMELFPIFENICQPAKTRECETFIIAAIHIADKYSLPLNRSNFEDRRFWHHQIEILKAAQTYQLSIDPLSKPFNERGALRQLKIDFNNESNLRLNIFIGEKNG